jgi:hypothetical protein
MFSVWHSYLGILLIVDEVRLCYSGGIRIVPAVIIHCEGERKYGDEGKYLKKIIPGSMSMFK